MSAHKSQTATSYCYVRTSQCALLEWYMGVGHSPPYIYYELLILYVIMVGDTSNKISIPIPECPIL